MNIDLWKNLKIGDKILLKDPDRKYNVEDNTEYITRRIEKIQTIQESDDLVTWIILYLMDDVIDDLRVIIKIVDNDVEFMTVYDTVICNGITRSELISQNVTWMFDLNLSKDENININDLKFIDHITYSNHDENEDENEFEYEYNKISYDTMYAESAYLPDSTMDGIFTSVTEYICDDVKAPFNYVIIIEEGENEDDGGHISIFTGFIMNEFDIKISK